MKKMIFKILIFIIVLFLLVFSLYLWKSKNPKENLESGEKEENKGILRIEGIDEDSCIDTKKFYFEDKGVRYYLSCLSDVKVTFKDKKISLKEAIEENMITMEEVMKEMPLSEAIPSISSILYKTENNSLVSNLSVIQCNTSIGNQDYYIGNKDMKYEEGFCERNCSFTRTYYILSVESDSDYNYYNVTLMQHQGNEISTVRIKRELNQKYKMNAAYEFTFTKDELDIITDESIKNIFDAFRVIKIEQTDKEGLNQTQDKICQIK